MKLRATFLFFLLLLKASIVAATVNDKNIAVSVGGVTISARTPTGFYKTSDTYPAYFSSAEKYATGKEGKLLSLLVPEKDYLRLKNNQNPNSGRYMTLKVSKFLINEYVTERHFDELKALVRKEQYTATNDLSSDINKELNRISRNLESDYNHPYKLNLKLGETTPLGLFIDETNAIGSTNIAQIKGKIYSDSDSELTKVATTSFVLVRGRLIYVSVYSAFNTLKDIIWAEAKSKELVGLILNNNQVKEFVNAREEQKGVNAYNSGDYATALKEFKPLAEKGNLKAQLSLGLMYQYGTGVTKDSEKAIVWLLKAAEGGDKIAQSWLGIQYMSGNGVPLDNQKAFKWISRAAEQGHAGSQDMLGIMYESGKGVDKDYKKSFEWRKRAAMQNDPQAQFSLGIMYQLGQGVKKDLKEAVKWLKKSAGLGYPDAIKYINAIKQFKKSGILNKKQ